MKKLISLCLVALATLTLFSVPATAAMDLSKYSVESYPAPTYFSPEATELIGSIWTYEYSIGHNADFKPMTKKLGLWVSNPDGANETYACLVSPWNTDLYLYPGGAGENAVQTFNAPADGYVTVRSCDVVRHYAMKDVGDEALQDCEIAIYLNDKKIWPEGNAWKTLTAAASAEQAVENICSVPELTELQVKAGDKIRFVLGAGTANYSNWNDYVKWYATVDMYTEGVAESSKKTDVDDKYAAAEGEKEVEVEEKEDGDKVLLPEDTKKQNGEKKEANIVLIVIFTVVITLIVVAGLGVGGFFLYKKKINAKR